MFLLIARSIAVELELDRQECDENFGDALYRNCGPRTRSQRACSPDIQLSTSEFLAYVKAFDNHGLVLVQSYQPIPDTLDLARIAEEQQDSVLIQNGAFLRMWLPHAIETASVTCYQPGDLATIHG